MATRLIGTDTIDPRLPAVVIAATQGTTASDLAPGDVIADANAYTDAAIAEVIAGGVSFADDAQTIAGAAANLAVTPAGLAAKLPAVDVREFGAVGDGVADDTAAIQAAIDSVSNAIGTGISPLDIDLGVGTYRITTTITLTRRAVIVRGHGIGNASNYSANPGHGTTIKWDGPAGIPMIVVQDSRHVVFEDLWLQGHDTNIPSEGIYFEATPGASVGTNEQIVCNRVRFGFGWYLTGGYKMNHCVRFGGSNANNDQFTFRNCVFDHPAVSCVTIANSQSIWGSFQDCFFDGNTTAKGIDTAASCTLVNPQFNNCTVDVTVGPSAQVTILGWQSEGSRKLATLGSAARLVARGGHVNGAAVVGGYAITATLNVSGGCIDLDSVICFGFSASKQIQAIAVSAAQAGSVSIRNCSLLPEALALSSQTGGTLQVAYEDRGIFDRSVLSGAATYAPPAALTARIATPGLSLLSGTGSPQSVVTAGIGTKYIDTAATNGAIEWVKTTASGNTGWRVTYGDTGRRDVSASLINSWTGTVSLRRINDIVYLEVTPLTAPGSISSATFIALPAGFQVAGTQTGYCRSLLHTAANVPYRTNFPGGDGSSLQCQAIAAAAVYGTVQIALNPGNAWPATLPGTAIT